MIEFKDVSIRTRVDILHDVYFEFNKGRIYGLVAINGAGKTTIFRSIMQLIPIANGRIEIDGKSPKNKMDITFYFENESWLDINLSGLDYLRFVSRVWKSCVSIEETIRYWDAEEYIGLAIKKYSLGMKQRLIIMMYVVSDADYLLMDEITNGLDDKNRMRFFKMVEELAKANKTVILSSHYKEDLENVCDSIVYIRDGKLRETYDEVYSLED